MSAQAFPSKYSGGKCAANGSCVHGGTIHKGQLIRWSRKQRGVVWHDECFKERNDSDDIAVNNVVPISNSNSQENNHVSSVAVAVEPQANDLASTLAVALAPYLQSQLKSKVDEDTVISLVQSAMEPMQKRIDALTVPQRIEVFNRESQEVKDMGLQHEAFPLILQTLSARTQKGYCLNVFLSGPTGSGKTTVVENAAKAMDKRYGFAPAIDTEYKVSGYMDANGRYVSTLFRDFYENGGVFALEECDSSSPSATLWLNNALANGFCAFPDKLVPRHKDFMCFAIGNTWGLGASSDYVGRNKLDAAFLSRFGAKIFIGYDEKLELATAGNEDWTRRVQTIRKRVNEKGIKVCIAPRMSYDGAALLATGMSQDIVERIVIHAVMSTDQWQSVR